MGWGGVGPGPGPGPRNSAHDPGPRDSVHDSCPRNGTTFNKTRLEGPPVQDIGDRMLSRHDRFD